MPPISAVTGAAALVVSILVAMIGYRQWRTSQTRLQIDLYEKRLPVFLATREFLGHVTRQGRATQEQIITFREQTLLAPFLFGKDIDRYLFELGSRAFEILTDESLLSGMPPGEQRAARVQAKSENFRAVMEAYGRLESLFAPYLTLEQRSHAIRPVIAAIRRRDP